jgi:ubiquinone/menaquinone biosynthesis C-methylase UbiE
MAARDATSARRDVARFDRWAETYDRSFLQRRVFEPIHAAMLGALESMDGQRVLDVGCGTGILTRALARRSARAVGVDPAPRMVAKAKEGGGVVALYAVAAAEALPFADSTFGGASASFTVHHWRDARSGLAELGRVLRPGARLAIAEIDLPGPARRVLRLLGSPHAGWSRRELADVLYRSGFRRVRTMPRGPLGRRLAVLVADR